MGGVFCCLTTLNSHQTTPNPASPHPEAINKSLTLIESRPDQLQLGAYQPVFGTVFRQTLLCTGKNFLKPSLDACNPCRVKAQRG
jgi:hypothetical protein